MNIYAMFEDLRQQDLRSISAHYDALIDAEIKASEQRAERLRELVSVEKSESKARIDSLQATRASALSQVEHRYSAPRQDIAADEMAGVVVTGSAHNASEN